MMTSKRGRYLLSGLLLATLVGCADSGVEEVRVWMKEVKDKTKVHVKPLSEPKKFTPNEYLGKNQPDPFNVNKLMDVLNRLQPKSSNGLKRDEDRRREALESMPLDTIKMVGLLQKSGATFGLVQVEKTVYQVKVGNYLGQNEGRITSVTESQIELVEKVEDATGELVERKATLELQENRK